MVDQLVPRQVVERLRVARRTATGVVRNVVDLGGRGRSIRQRFRAEQVRPSIHARTLRVDRAPDLDCPIGGARIGIEHRAQPDHHGRAHRRGRELVLACPLHPHGAVRRSHCDERGIERSVIGRVVPVAAGALPVQDRDLRGIDVQCMREPFAQLEHALGVGPDRQRTVPVLRQRA